MTSAAKARSPLAAILLLATVPLLFHLVILVTRRIPIALTLAGLCKAGLVSAAALMHWSIYAGLLAGFGLTLRRGRTPLITAMVTRLHGPLTPALRRYTRRVTIAWTLFFAAQLSLSVGLFCFAPLTAWSFFVNVLDLPLVAAMFAAEYAVRVRVLDNPPRESLAAIFAMVEGSLRPAPPARLD